MEQEMPVAPVNASGEDPQGERSCSAVKNLTKRISWISWMRRNRVLASSLGGLSALLVTAIIVGVICYLKFVPMRPPPTGYLAEYKVLPSHEVYRPQPAAVLNNTHLPDCLANCSTNHDFECLHTQFCAPEGTEIGTCHLFRGNAKLRTRLAGNCDLYTRGDPADFGIPHGGSPSLNKGGPGWLSWIPVGVIFVNAIVTLPATAR
ncbi:uncharacterized protein LOC119165530 [Rhipicephalus microplus]|uniref:uncharacterized protein LOC119165530 n=1 Tax=Rhipicephalus microplus TaxID=6941 RepID=UPI001889C344|nr:uncharacterized protein LOC119165530 [Rhipicephalus microplus]